MTGDTERYTVNSISNVGPFTVASLSSTTNRVVVDIASNANVQTYNVHFRVNYTITEIDPDTGEAVEGTTTHHHKDENYTVVVEADFYAGILLGTGVDSRPSALTAFASGDNRGVIANGKSVTVTNNLAGTGTLYLACLLYTSPSPRDRQKSRMPSSA